MKDENLNERAIYIGKLITDRMENFKKNCPEIGDVRGLGAMIGIEFIKDNDPGKPHTELCAKIVKGCAEDGLILISAGTFKNVIRILCPLVITDEQLNSALDILENQIKKHT